MTSNHQFFGSDSRVSQPLRNDRCQNILYKAVFEHFIELPKIAALLLTSKSFQNSSFGANFLANFVVDEDSIRLLESVLSPSSCFSVQLVPSLYINQSAYHPENSKHMVNFVGEIVNSKYLRLSLRSLSLGGVQNEVLSSFFGSSSNSWPQLLTLALNHCELGDYYLEIISKNARQLRTVNVYANSGITDAGLEHLSDLANISDVNLAHCHLITDAGVQRVSTLARITSLNLSYCDQITGVGVEQVSEQLSGITSLKLHGRGITDVGLKLVSRLSNITSLDLAFCYLITDIGVEQVSKLSSITSLDLLACDKITDVGLDHVSKLSRITRLNLRRCDKITDDCIKHVAKLSNITFLNLCGTKIGSAAKNELKMVLPNCYITD